ncbi:hypothetical protein NPIL_365931 [Nephila pilipes]|uniref:Uncharacterized protein n=1 Tax=Nephila pilipes TaxID=299642 RepID=A0A8X6Q898_NEPPI|nr:hypothetical protein NPIL_365931 [Nephila pilipes]
MDGEMLPSLPSRPIFGNRQCLNNNPDTLQKPRREKISDDAANPVSSNNVRSCDCACWGGPNYPENQPAINGSRDIASNARNLNILEHF